MFPMSYKIDFTTMTTTHVIRIGDKKIMWGSGTTPSVAGNTDVPIDITFPEEFDNVPVVFPVVAGWPVEPFAWVRGDKTTKTGTTLLFRHKTNSRQELPYYWFAIG